MAQNATTWEVLFECAPAVSVESDGGFNGYEPAECIEKATGDSKHRGVFLACRCPRRVFPLGLDRKTLLAQDLCNEMTWVRVRRRARPDHRTHERPAAALVEATSGRHAARRPGSFSRMHLSSLDSSP